MKTLILAFILSATGHASEFQMIDGAEAYKLYLSLPGVRCTEWNLKDFVVYTKYQTANCSDQGESSQWTCTVQINKMQPQQKFVSASCTRELND